MDDLDRLYLRLLYDGLVSIRNASRRGDLDYCRAESEHLHEVPSLIGETNRHRHVYQATEVRAAYLEWVSRNGRDDVRAWVQTWVAPVWKQIDALLGLDPPGPL